MAAFESHLIVVPQMRTKITILIGGDYDDHIKAFTSKRLTKMEKTVLAEFLRDNKNKFEAVTLIPTTRPQALFIYFHKRPDLTKPDTVDTIAHEILHCTFSILKRLEVRFNSGSEEAFTYLHGYLMGEFWKRLKPTP